MSRPILRGRESPRHFRKNFLILPIYVILLFVGIGFSQNTSVAGCGHQVESERFLRRVLLEAEYIGVGMVAPQGKHLYLRVFDNGDYEFEDQVVGKTGSNFEIRKGALSKLELKDFCDFLSDASVVNIPTEIPPPSDPLDHVIEIKLRIKRGDDHQNITITNFSPNSKTSQNFYSKPFLDLLRRIEALRKCASFSIVPGVGH